MLQKVLIMAIVSHAAKKTHFPFCLSVNEATFATDRLRLLQNNELKIRGQYFLSQIAPSPRYQSKAKANTSTELRTTLSF